MIEELEKDGKLYALIFGNEWEEGLQFYTDDGDFVQVGTWNYPAGKILKPHAHKKCERKSLRTQEVLHLTSGKVKLTIFDDRDKVFCNRILNKGDTAIMFYGGHGYKVLEDSTKVIEVKNGPYPGIEKDKHVIGDEA